MMVLAYTHTNNCSQMLIWYCMIIHILLLPELALFFVSVILNSKTAYYNNYEYNSSDLFLMVSWMMTENVQFICMIFI